MASLAILPLEPGLFSTTTGWPICCCSFSPITRAAMSGAPPGGMGTMRWIGREGYDCADTAAANRQSRKPKARGFMRASVPKRPRYVNLAAAGALESGDSDDRVRRTDLPAYAGAGRRGRSAGACKEPIVGKRERAARPGRASREA